MKSNWINRRVTETKTVDSDDRNQAVASPWLMVWKHATLKAQNQTPAQPDDTKRKHSASSGGYKVTVQNQVTAVDESIVTVVVFAMWRATSSAQTLHVSHRQA